MDVCGLRGGSFAGRTSGLKIRASLWAALLCFWSALLVGCGAPGGTATNVKVESPTPEAAAAPSVSPTPTPQATASPNVAPAAASSLKKTNLTPADRRAWRKIIKWPDDCEEAYEKTMSKETAGLNFYELAAGQYLVEVVCTTGAYQGYQFYSYLDETKSPPSATLLSFQSFESEEEGKPKKRTEIQEVWGLATFDAKAKRLEIHNKYRGPGDCGSLATYEFPGGTPRLKEFREKSACDGEYVEPKEWPRIFP